MKRKLAFSIILILMMLVSLVPFAGEVSAADDPDLYRIKVNRQMNVVTVYRNEGGDYVPFRAMICSVGGNGHETPIMTSGIDMKFRWLYLIGDVWGQYRTQIDGDYLFHSVYYEEKGEKDTLVVEEYNKLGTGCSKGCIRLSVMNAKWIYENCCKDTIVEVYDSPDPGPLGKPDPQRLDKDARWDPTDPDDNNPEFFMLKPVITIGEKSQILTYGCSYDLLDGVTAVDPNTFQDLTSSVKVSAIRRWNGEKWVETEFSTKCVGRYNITYEVYDKYCGGTAYETLAVKVIDYRAPIVEVPDEMVVKPGCCDLLQNVSAKQKSRNRIGAVKVKVIEPDGDILNLNYAEAKTYVFEEHGDYFVTYTVSNYYDESKKDSEMSIIRCLDEFEQNTLKWKTLLY